MCQFANFNISAYATMKTYKNEKLTKLYAPIPASQIKLARYLIAVTQVNYHH